MDRVARQIVAYRPVAFSMQMIFDGVCGLSLLPRFSIRAPLLQGRWNF
jgi:hypothetical protein